MKCVLALILAVMSSAALAQTTGTVDPTAPSVTEEVPPGGCMPIGLTAAGEMVFPLLCKEFLERRRGMTVEQNVGVDKKPAAFEEKASATQTQSGAPENSKPANKENETVSMPKRAENEPRERALRSDDCTRYRTYDAASGTYRGYDGRRRSCRSLK